MAISAGDLQGELCQFGKGICSPFYRPACSVSPPPFCPHLLPSLSCSFSSTYTGLAVFPSSREFAFAVPSAWNALPPDIHMAHLLTPSTSLLKCHLFRVFPDHLISNCPSIISSLLLCCSPEHSSPPGHDIYLFTCSLSVSSTRLETF